MTNSRKELMRQIDGMAHQLKQQQSQVEEHRRYFRRLVVRHDLVISVSLLLPAFLIGWRQATKVQLGDLVRVLTFKELIRLSLLVIK